MSDLFVTRIALSEAVLSDLVDRLNVQLANTIVAQQMVKFAHWNVKGPGFFPTHKLFDRVFKALVKATDRIGERITALGGVAEGLPEMVANNTTLSDYSATSKDNVRTHIEAVANVVAEVANELRVLSGNVPANGIVLPAEDTAIRDLVTQNMLLDITEDLDQLVYFLEANLRA